MQRPQLYQELVDYGGIDPFKVDASEAAATTAPNLTGYGYYELPASRGESAFVWDEGDR